MKRSLISALCLSLLSCSSQSLVSDPSQAPELARMLPAELADMIAGELQLALDAGAVELLAEQAGLDHAQAAVAGATRSYSSDGRSVQIFVFELQDTEQAGSFYRDHEQGWPTPIPGFGVRGRTRVGRRGAYEVETWQNRYFIRAVSAASDRATRRHAYQTTRAVLEQAVWLYAEPARPVHSKLAEAAEPGNG